MRRVGPVCCTMSCCVAKSETTPISRPKSVRSVPQIVRPDLLVGEVESVSPAKRSTPRFRIMAIRYWQSLESSEGSQVSEVLTTSTVRYLDSFVGVSVASLRSVVVHHGGRVVGRAQSGEFSLFLCFLSSLAGRSF